MAIEAATKLSLNDSHGHGAREEEHMSAPLMDSHRRQQHHNDHDMFMGIASSYTMVS